MIEDIIEFIVGIFDIIFSFFGRGKDKDKD